MKARIQANRQRRISAQKFTSVRIRQIPGYPLMIWFLGRSTGLEHVTWFTDTESGRLDSALGLFVHAVISGVRPGGFPEELWGGNRSGNGLLELHLDDWFAEAGNHLFPLEYQQQPPSLSDVMRRVPLDRIQLRPSIMVSEVHRDRYEKLLRSADEAYAVLNRSFPGWRSQRLPSERDPQEIRLLNMLRKPNRYIYPHSSLTFLWAARDIEAAAWCEVLHAWQIRATARRCGLCRTLFLRPRAFAGKFCPTCRELNWRQQMKIGEYPQQIRRGLALAVARDKLLGQPFANWEDWGRLSK